MPGRNPAFWMFIVVLVVLHFTLRLALGLTVIPDLLVVAALLGARRLGGGGAAACGFGLGVLADSLTITGFGASAVAYVVACYIGSRSRNLFEGDSFMFTLVYVFFGAWLIDVIRFLVGGAFERGEPALALVTATPLLALYTAIAAFLTLLAYRGLTGNR